MYSLLLMYFMYFLNLLDLLFIDKKSKKTQKIPKIIYSEAGDHFVNQKLVTYLYYDLLKVRSWLLTLIMII